MDLVGNYNSSFPKWKQTKGNVKVKLSLCLIKHHAMKTYWGSGSIEACIFNLGTKWR
jgi:hypothetical protein